MKTSNKRAEEVLSEITKYYLENYERNPEVSDKGLFDASFIFQTFLMSKMWALQESENMSMEVRGRMATKAGEEIRRIILTFTGIDMREIAEKL